MDKEIYINRIKEVKENFTETKDIFKEIQKIASDLRNEYQIALFEDNKGEMKYIHNFLYSLVVTPPKEISEGYIERKTYGYVYNEQTPQQKINICSSLYDPRINHPDEKTLNFLSEYVDMKKFEEIVLISLFYL